MRLSWIPSEKQYLAKKAEFVSTVCPISFCPALYSKSIVLWPNYLPTEYFIAND